MRATEILMEEHRWIEQVLDCLERMAQRSETDRRLDPALAREAVFFLRTFADRCHHGKEEAQLFPMMEARGFSPEAGPTAVMRVEHDQGRALVGRIDDAIEGAADGREDAIQAFADSARAFVGLLREHIRKEDHCLFPMADQALTEDDRAALDERFERVDDAEIGRDVIERCRRIADTLAEELDVPRIRSAKADSRLPGS